MHKRKIGTGYLLFAKSIPLNPRKKPEREKPHPARTGG
jgi:hypothetical protein